MYLFGFSVCLHTDLKQAYRKSQKNTQILKRYRVEELLEYSAWVEVSGSQIPDQCKK